MQATGARSGEALEDLVKRNVEVIAKLEQSTQSQRTTGDIIADAIAGFCGRMTFVYVHVVALGFWMLWNSPWLAHERHRIDPPPFQMMNTTLAVEAIFLTTFVLISQNRQQRIADRRNHMDLQINMLAEQENSQVLRMLQELLEFHGIGGTRNPEVEALKQVTDPEILASQIDQSMEDVKPDEIGPF